MLAGWAAIAIENARLYEGADRRRDELERAVRGLEATTAIARAVGGETRLERVLELDRQARPRARRARAASLIAAAPRATSSSSPRRRARCPTRSTARVPIAARARRRPASGARRARRRRRRRASARASASPARSAALLVPLVFRGRALGVLAAFDRARRRRRLRRRRRAAADGVRRQRRDRGRDRADRRARAPAPRARAPPRRSAGAGRASCTTRRCRGSRRCGSVLSARRAREPTPTRCATPCARRVEQIADEIDEPARAHHRAAAGGARRARPRAGARGARRAHRAPSTGLEVDARRSTLGAAARPPRSRRRSTGSCRRR